MKTNSGRDESSAHAGQKIYTDYPLDRSSWAGSKEDERGKTLAGGPDDLSHSLSGVKAEMGVPKRGRADTVKYPTKVD